MAEEDYNQGTVHLPLAIYNAMRDELDQRRQTTLVHEEFLKKFRVSLLTIIEELQKKGIDLQDAYGYYKDLTFPPIKSLKTEKTKDKTTLKIVLYED